MRQRPAACLALLVFLIFRLLPAGFFYESCQVEGKCEVQINGRVSRQIQQDEKTQIYLRDCQVESETVRFHTKNLLIYLSDSAEYPVGTDLSLSGTIYPIEEPSNPGQFDRKLYYQGKGIAYTVYADRVHAEGRHPAPVREGLLAVKNRIAQVYENVFCEQDSGLLRAMVLGERGELDAEIKEQYQKNGISHLLAISGLHISLIGMGMYRMLRRLTGSGIWSGIPVIIFLGAYGWMTGASVSTVRAVLMCSLVIGADVCGRTYDMLTGVGISALILLAANPLNARQSAFLLSFGAVLAIGLIQPLWNFWRGKGRRNGRPYEVSLSILILTFPLLLRFFFEYPPYSVFLNLLVIPLMSILMIFGLLCGFAGICSLPAAHLLGIPCHLILGLYEWLGRRCLQLPGAVCPVGSPALWKVILYYGLVSMGLIWCYSEKRRKKYWLKKTPFHPRKRILSGSLGLLLAGMTVLCLRVHTGLEITMLDVGQGDAVFFRSPSGTTFLYDGGSTNVSEVGEYRILPFLGADGIRTLDYMMISHMDQDHISGLKELIEDSQKPWGICIGHAVLPDLSVKDEAYEEMTALLAEAGIPVLLMGAGDRMTEGDFSIQCLWPEREEYADDRNDLSMVLLTEYREFQMLLTGDIGKETERRLLSLELPADVEVLKTAHHGSRYSSSEAFLERIRPSVSLISCSAANRYGHPGEETIQRLQDAGSRILITKDSGAIRIWTDGHRVKVQKFRRS